MSGRMDDQGQVSRLCVGLVVDYKAASTTGLFGGDRRLRCDVRDTGVRHLASWMCGSECPE